MDAKLKHLFAAKHRLADARVAELDDVELGALARMIRGTEHAPDRTVAIDVLSRAAPEAAKPVMRELLHDRTQPDHLRAAAITNLARLAGDDVEQVLLDGVDAHDDELLHIKLAGALGRVGGQRSVGRLESMAHAGVGPLQRQARLSLMLLGIRHEHPHVGLPVPDAKQLLVPRPGHLRSFDMVAATPERLAEVHAHIARDSWGLTLSQVSGHAITCGRNRMTLMWGEQLVAKPALAGVLAQQVDIDGSWATRFLLLSGPAAHGPGMRLHLYRTNGALVLAGALSKAGEFELVAVADGANTPARIVGSVVGTALEFTVLETENHVIGKQQPTASSL